MRFLTVVALGLILVTPTIGHADNNTGKGHNFGSATCSRKVSCPGEGIADDSSELVSNASACLTQNFGYTAPSGFFESYGLDSNNCLTPKAGAIAKGMGAALIPQCCIVKLPDNSCTFHCDLLTN